MNRWTFLAVALVVSTVPAFAQGAHIMGIGDSLGEGDQSSNAFTLSQQQSYLNYIATQSRVPFSLPLIQSGPYGSVGVTAGRSRVNAALEPLNLAVSGATVDELLNNVAVIPAQHEIDLVLPPYYGMTQIQIVEQVKPGYVFCWIGNDDLINYILDFSQLNSPTGITPIDGFTTDIQSLMSRLKATGAKVVVGNITDFTHAGYLFDNDDVTKYLGTNYNLPAGSYTTLSAIILIKLGQETPAIFTNPAYVLSSEQIVKIQNQIRRYNQVISAAAAANGFPLVDTFGVVDSLITKPVTIEGVTINTHFNGGAFSLDGVHPSDTGYALFANAFIKAANTAYNAGIPVIPAANEVAIFNADPFVDFNGNGIVPGRPNTGLLETEGPMLGFSGDTNEHGAAVAYAMRASAQTDPNVFMRVYFEAKGMDRDTPWTKADAVKAVGEMLHSPAH